MKFPNTKIPGNPSCGISADTWG